MKSLIDNHAAGAWRGLRIWHGLLGREGGVSRGPFASLNFSYLAGDDPAAVQTNWRRLHACFPPGVEFVQVHQVHRNQVHVVDRHSRGITAVADGMVTAAPNMILAILTADCVPILLFDADAGVAGALHAGWRGVIADIVSAGISAMASIGARPERIRAALGPAIGACCFEVDIELARRFEAEIADAQRHVRQASDEKAFIDLKGLVRDQLVREGLAAGAITDVAVCTRCSSDRYFSRRSAKGGATGLQLSFIGMQE
ncbi:MAG: peptidoglycan editing factor PgeF [Candidatus Binataceae bacterium]